MSTLTDIQRELKVPKSRKNSFGGYNYRSLEDILEAVKPLLTKYNATLRIWDDMQEVGSRVYVVAHASLSDGTETWQAQGFAREAESKKGMDDSQITGTASSYARKYALNGLFLIDDTKDADTDEYQMESKARSEREEVAGKKISQNKATALMMFIQNNFNDKDAAITWVLSRYGVEAFINLTEGQYSEAYNLLQKQAERAKKDGDSGQS